MTEIVKVQIPIATNEEHAPILIYAEGHDRIVLANDLIPAAQSAMGNDIKAYFRATWDADNEAWHLRERVEDQPW